MNSMLKELIGIVSIIFLAGFALGIANLAYGDQIITAMYIQKDVVVYTLPACSACEAAKAILRKDNISYVEKSVTEKDNKEELKELLPDNNYVPQIFIDGLHIGGLSELQKMDNNGTLVKLVKGE